MKEEEIKPNQKKSYTELWNISKWCLRFIYKSSPGMTVLYMTASIINYLRDFVYLGIFSSTLDAIIRIAGSENPNVNDIYPYLGMIVAYNIGETIMSALEGFGRNNLRTRIYPYLTREFYLKISSLGVKTIEQAALTNKISRADGYLNQIFYFTQQIIDMISSVIRLVASAVMIISFMPAVGGLMVLVLIPRSLLDKRFRRIMYDFDYENTEKRRKTGGAAGDLMSPKMLNEISITGAIQYLDNIYTSFRNWETEWRVKKLVRWNLTNHGFGIFTDLVTVFGIFFTFIKVTTKEITVGGLNYWLRTLNIFSNTLRGTISTFNDVSEFYLRIKDVYDVFMTTSDLPDGKIKLKKLEIGPEIILKNVSFSYPNAEKEVLHNINLHIKPNEKIAIVGHNGAGKTTLIKLLARFYDATSGKITLNGKELKEYQLDSLHANMGVLFQDFNMYPYLTAKDNIVIGDPDTKPDETRMLKAAEQADALAFINDFPKKFDQVLSERFERGIRPSTGQWQKIAIARFFYRNSPLVIFDEPTASIDAVSEYKIFNSIYDFFKNKTVVIVSHRFSTVRNADRILVVKNGEIIEQGNHKELMELNGSYAEAFNLQAKGYAEEITQIK